MPLQQNIFAAGNFTMAKAGNLFGLNGTFGDLDMLPMSASWWADGPARMSTQQHKKMISFFKFPEVLSCVVALFGHATPDTGSATRRAPPAGFEAHI